MSRLPVGIQGSLMSSSVHVSEEPEFAVRSRVSRRFKEGKAPLPWGLSGGDRLLCLLQQPTHLDLGLAMQAIPSGPVLPDTHTHTHTK